jgi:hypothetical protein
MSKVGNNDGAQECPELGFMEATDRARGLRQTNVAAAWKG